MPIKIRSKQAGFRRCGVAHPAEWVEHPDGRFSPEEVDRLRAEPMLQVQVIEQPTTDSSDALADPSSGADTIELAPEEDEMPAGGKRKKNK